MTVDELLEKANHGLARVKNILSQVDVQYIELAPGPFGVGLAVPWDETEFIVLTVLGPPNDNKVWITAGALFDIQQQRCAALDLCNRLTRDQPSFPVYLHDAEAGWDILIGTSFPIDMVTSVPNFFVDYCASLPVVIRHVREECKNVQEVGGLPYIWNSVYVHRLFLRSCA